MRITVKMFGDGRKEGVFFVIRRIGNDIAVRFCARAEMQKERCIAAVVEDHVGKTAIWPLKNAVCEFPVFLNGFAFFGEDGDAIFHDCCSGVVLGREDVAARPANFGAQCRQGFNKNRRLNGHVQRSGDTCAF